MSLISEALRKARQGAAGRGMPAPAIVPQPRSRLGAGLVLGAAIALAAALAGAGAVWWLVGGGTPGAARVDGVGSGSGADGEPPQAPVDVRLSPRATGSGAATAGSPAAAFTPVTRLVPPTTPALSPAAAREPEREAAEPQPTPADAPSPVAVADGRSVQPSPSPRPAGWRAGERDYVLEADLGGTTLSLDFIVYRSDDPFAEINGTEVHEGSVIEGFVVDRIERDRVVLRDGDGSLVLRVR